MVEKRSDDRRSGIPIPFEYMTIYKHHLVFLCTGLIFKWVDLVQGWPNHCLGAKNCSPRHFQVPFEIFLKFKVVKKVMRILQQLIEKLMIAGVEIAFDMV